LDKSERSHREHVIVDLGDGVEAAKLQSTWLVPGVTTIAERIVSGDPGERNENTANRGRVLGPSLVRC
jgi:hypothetical protein